MPFLFCCKKCGEMFRPREWKIGGVYWTDYPIVELGDIPYQRAPIRKVIMWGYDGDKYCQVEVCGVKKEIKEGYIYTRPRRM